MGWTKRQIIEDAYGELAIAGYVFEKSPEEMQAALRRLDTMMAEWAARDINVGYAFGLTPDDTDLDQDSGVPLIAVGAMRQKLAIAIAASKGKGLAPSTHRTAKSAFDALLSAVATQQVRQQQLPNTLPRGAGNKPFRHMAGPFFRPRDVSPLSDGPDGCLIGD